MTGSRHCLQHAGDVLFVPRLWGHAVLNSATCIGCAQGDSELQLDPTSVVKTQPPSSPTPTQPTTIARVRHAQH